MTSVRSAEPSDTPATSARAIAEAATCAGAFGPDGRFVSFELDGRHTELDQFATAVLYGTVTVDGSGDDDDDDDDGRRRSSSSSYRLVFKLKHRSAALRELYCSDKQFHNETLFYERIAPYLLDRVPADRDPSSSPVARPPLCRYFYGRNDGGDRVLDDVIVLENAGARGYRMSDARLHLDYDHLVVALRTLAKFHGLSYRAKHEDPTGFAEQVVAGLEETQYMVTESGEQWMMGDVWTAALFSVALDRLAERGGGGGGGGGGAGRARMAELLRDPTGTMRRVMRPAEPLAVLCHGDYNRNNLMFRYDEAGGRPVDALPLDTATARYGSPALDLSFFLYMNTDRGTRDRHWDALLDEYCAALSAAVADASAPVPDRARLDAEMRDRAVYGLAHASFYLRVMAAAEDGEPIDVEQYADMADESLRSMAAIGGDRATDLIADAFQHYLDRVCA